MPVGRLERFSLGKRLIVMRISATLLVLPLATCLAQPSSTLLGNGIRLKVTVNTGNSDPDPLKVDMKTAAANSVYRILHDESGLAVFAYELVVDRLGDGDRFQIVAKPAGAEFAARFPDADGGKPTPTFPRQVESAPLNAGGKFTIEVPTQPGLFQHRIDTVEVQPDPQDGGTAARKQPAQSEALIRFTGLRVAINGELIPASGAGKLVSGPYVMFYIPKRGGYFFSARSVDSKPFVQIGTVEQNRLKFVIENDEFDCASITPILTQSDGGQIWVYYDRDFKPADKGSKSSSKSRDEFFIAASDTLSGWLP